MSPSDSEENKVVLVRRDGGPSGNASDSEVKSFFELLPKNFMDVGGFLIGR